MRHLKPNQKSVLETDESDYFSGGVFSNDSILHPIAYCSNKHFRAVCNYKSYNKKLTAVRVFQEKRYEPQKSISP